MNLFRVILLVSDIDRAAAFYAVVLGQAGERVSPGRHYFVGDASGAILACYSPEQDGDAEELGTSWTPHPNQYVYFSAADLEAVRTRCLQAGASQVTPIEQMPWGETLFYANDPFGNPIAFVRAGTEFVGGARESA